MRCAKLFRDTRLVLVLGALGAACGGAALPRDGSNAVLPTTRAYQTTNMNAVETVTPTREVQAILAEPDRQATDRAEDNARQAAEFLTYLDVKPGARVAELATGVGYTAELLARSVGQEGVVYAQNEPTIGEYPRIDAALKARLARPANAKIERLDRSLATPLPLNVRQLDLVLLGTDYTRLEERGIDVDAMNHAIHLALKPGGRYVIVARTPFERGRIADLHALHTEASRHIRRSVEGAGFVLASEGRFFRGSNDPRDWNATPPGGALGPSGEDVDRFVLTFVRP